MSEKVVTRFAPSPTGYLHIGGARTALFNWLYARRMGGSFILRIEDTDQSRNTPTAMKQVMADLRWLGIDWDEGPEVEGPNSPYLQSQRRDMYDQYLQKLLDEGKAYYCFDTPEELKAMRDAAAAKKENFAYRPPEIVPTEADVKKARSDGRPVTVRFIMPTDKPFVVNDLVRGEVTFAPGELGDFIIQKSDGFPTYHFACVVDDELMGVTHIIRGQEHLMNTPCHQALQDALGFRRPTYAHMSVTVSEGGGKLSKRERPKTLIKAIKQMQDIDLDELAAVGGVTREQVDQFLKGKGKTTLDMPVVDALACHLGVHLPEINVVDFFRSGYLPETMINFLALLGWNPGDDREILQRQELVECFDLARLSKTNSLFDRNKLVAFNTEHIKLLDTPTLTKHFRDYLNEINSPVANADDQLLARIVEMNQGARTLEQIEQKTRFAFVSAEDLEFDSKAVKKVLLKEGAVEILREIGTRLEQLDAMTPDKIENMLRSLAEEKQVGLGKVAQPLRVAISGGTVSPPIFDSVDMLGIENTLQRINIAIERFDNGDQ